MVETRTLLPILFLKTMCAISAVWQYDIILISLSEWHTRIGSLAGERLMPCELMLSAGLNSISMSVMSFI